MKKFHFPITLVMLLILLVFGRLLFANPNWNADYPMAGSTVGTIISQGTITPPNSYVTTGTARVTIWPVGGGPEIVTSFTLPSGQSGNISWGPWTVSGLTSGTPYNVSVDIDLTASNSSSTNAKSVTTGTVLTYTTDPAQQTPE